MFKIVDGVPIPKRRGRPAKYPFADMEIGQSVFFKHQTTQCKAALAARAFGRAAGKKFVARAEADGVRVWREA